MTNAYLRAATDQETDEIHIVLLTIAHPDLAALEIDEPDLGISDGALRFTSNGEGVTSRGKFYKASGFTFTPPAQGEGERSLASIVIPNVDRRLTGVMRQLQGYAYMTVEIVLASDPDVVEEALPEFEMTSADWDALEIRAQLSVPDDDREPVTSYSFVPRLAPGLF